MALITEVIIENEVLEGLIDGSNKVFEIDHIPDPESSIELILNKTFQTLDDDFTIDGKVIIFTVAPPDGSKMRIGYRYVNAERLYISISKIVDAGNLASKDEDEINGSNIINNEGWTDDTAADSAQATADGKVVTFYQDAEPTAEGVGDLWVDTNDKNKLYRWSGSAWIIVRDTDIAQAVADAATAQTTADGKIVTFYQDAAPTAEGTGDFWVDTNDKNKLYRWSGSAWISVRDTDIAQAITDAATAQATADGKVVTFFQDAQPTAEGVGDLWVDTNDKNKLHRWSGSAWVTVRDTDIAQAISDASDAQSTADGKIVTFYQDAAPTAEGTGDFWIDTNDNNKPYRWSGSAWVAIDNPVADWSKVNDDDSNKPDNNATEGSVIDKLTWDRFALTLQFVTLDGWGYSGTGVTLESIAQAWLITGATINTTKYLYAGHSDDIDGAGIPTDDPVMQTTVKFSHATSQNAKIVIGDADDVCVGFKITNGTLYAYHTDNTPTDYTTEITGITLTNWNTYKIVFIGGTSIKFYVNGVLKHTATTNLPTNQLSTFVYYQIENTVAATRRMAVQNLIYIQDFFN